MCSAERAGYLAEMARAGYAPQSIGAFHRVMIPYLLERLGVRRDDLIVDVGAAQGHCILSARLAGYRNLEVVDIDPHNFGLFQARYGIRCHQCDVEQDQLPFDGSQVRAILNFHVIEHLRSPGKFLSEAMRVLERFGVLALVTPDWRKQYKQFWRDPTHIHPYDKESIARLLGIHGFAASVHPWSSRYGVGRLRAYQWFPQLGMIGADILAIGTKQ